MPASLNLLCWRSFRGWLGRSSVPGGPFDGGEGQRGVVVVQAGQCVLQIDGYRVGQARGEAQDAAFTAGTRQVRVVQGGDRCGPSAGNDGARRNANFSCSAAAEPPVGEEANQRPDRVAAAEAVA